ncbi:excisionase family DNA-binding protein [uncultured Serinicoccus sp.]|uniref:excisionase family DNA-binding protein n=1 Tax=uncultured Serinicoccus sp. TaxID=735514 RepID=UPI0026110560|nr:excisionase family DNA-binding protein [uncultured Serinicoccus sp.]
MLAWCSSSFPGLRASIRPGAIHAEAAERTGLSTCTLRRRIADGLLPAYRSGARIIRVDPDDVDKLLTRMQTVLRQG